MSKNTVRDSEEEKWRLESDVRLIREYATLIADKKRFEKAKEFIKKQENTLSKLLKSKEV